MFFIKEFEGTIWTNKRLDHEKERSHILNVSVTVIYINRFCSFSSAGCVVGKNDVSNMNVLSASSFQNMKSKFYPLTVLFVFSLGWPSIYCKPPFCLYNS